MTTTYLISLVVAIDDASEHRERARRSERAGEGASESACRGVRGAKPLGNLERVAQTETGDGSAGEGRRLAEAREGRLVDAEHVLLVEEVVQAERQIEPLRGLDDELLLHAEVEHLGV